VTGSNYTVTFGAGETYEGAVSITSANANLSIASGQTLGAAASAASGGTFTMTAGTVSLSGGVLKYYDNTLSGGAEITGYGTITNPAQGSQATLSTSGTGTSIVANGGILDIKGISSGLNSISISGSLVIDSSAKLKIDTNTSLVAGSNINFSSAADNLTLQSSTSTDFTGVGTATFNATLQNLNVGTVLNSNSGASVIDMTGLTITAVTATSISGDNLTITAGAVKYIFDTNASYAGDTLNTSSDGTNGTDIWIDTQVCYATGTRLLTNRGEIAVEDIAVGDHVVTLQDATQVLKPVKWVGYRHLDLTKHRKPETAAPIRIARHAFGENQPHRDLVVSPDHGLLVDGQLIPAKLLINGTTITQDRSVKSVTYYHIELDRHAILLAEGLPAESYLDTGNRAFFANAGLALVLHPEFEVNANLKCWEEDACAPLAVAPEVVGPVWHRLADRAATLGYTAPAVETTSDADVHLIADGRTVRPLSVDADRYVFMLPAGVADLRLASRACQPLAVVPYHDDPRQLGVLVSRIQIRNGAAVHDVPLDHPALSDGWHAVEQANGRTWRWTNGEGALPISGAANPLIIELKIHQMDAYLVSGSAAPVRLAA
jgi:hypothetical protein